jgi:hypothetical protein
VTAIEIDPVVHQFAEEYFGLPNMNVLYQDGRKFIENSNEKWDYILHDVFTGGSVPAHLFTIEMWNAVKAKLSLNGVVVVVRLCLFAMLIKNIVGSPEDVATRAVMSTLVSSFKYCRGFGDPLDTGTGAKNMVPFSRINLTSRRYSAPPLKSHSVLRRTTIIKNLA